MIRYDNKEEQRRDENARTEVITKKIAIAVAFAGVFFFFIKILFL